MHSSILIAGVLLTSFASIDAVPIPTKNELSKRQLAIPYSFLWPSEIPEDDAKDLPSLEELPPVSEEDIIVAVPPELFEKRFLDPTSAIVVEHMQNEEDGTLETSYQGQNENLEAKTENQGIIEKTLIDPSSPIVVEYMQNEEKETLAVPYTGKNENLEARKENQSLPFGSVINKCTVPRTLALTYDDGPSESTDILLDILQQFKAKATFFINGNNGDRGRVLDNEELNNTVKRAHKEGHQIASHSWSHPHMDQISSASREQELLDNDIMIEALIGKRPTYFRAPYLECSSESGCLLDLTRLNYHIIHHQYDTQDWSLQPDLQTMIQKFDAAINQIPENGNMLVLQHDTIPLSAHQLTKAILQSMKIKGWKAVTLAECLGQTPESAYRQV